MHLTPNTCPTVEPCIPCGDRRLYSAAPVAGIPYTAQKTFLDAVLTDMSVTVEDAVRALHPEVVERLQDRYPFTYRRIEDGGADECQRIMDMDEIDLLPSQDPADLPVRTGVEDCRKGEQHLAPYGVIPDLVIVPRIGADPVATFLKQPLFVVKDGILSARQLIAVMDEEDVQSFRPSATFASGS